MEERKITEQIMLRDKIPKARKQQYTTEEYNDIPVYYCEDCLSLRIKGAVVFKETLYCECCGSTNIKQAHIEGWQEICKKREKDFV